MYNVAEPLFLLFGHPSCVLPSLLPDNVGFRAQQSCVSHKGEKLFFSSRGLSSSLPSLVAFIFFPLEQSYETSKNRAMVHVSNDVESFFLKFCYPSSFLPSLVSHNMDHLILNT